MTKETLRAQSSDVEPGKIPEDKIDIKRDGQNATQGEGGEEEVVAGELQANDNSSEKGEVQDEREDFSLPSGIFGF